MVEDKHFTAGIVALRYHSGVPEILLLLKRKHHVYGLAKGHKDPGETDIQAACRELHEEAGCQAVFFHSQHGWTRDATQAEALPLFHRTKVSLKGKEKIRATKYFVATAEQTGAILDINEIEGAEWLPLTVETAERLVGRPELDFFHTHILPLAQVPGPS